MERLGDLDRHRLRSADPSGALDAIATVPRQIDEAAEAAASVDLGGLPSGSDVRTIVCCGMGGSGVGGPVLAAAAHASGRVPVVTVRGYAIPAFCGPDTLVVASSASGETAETLSAVDAARRAGARGVAITSGGTLGRLASEAGWPVVELSLDVQPRYAFGWLSTSPALVCDRLGLVECGPGWVEDTVAGLDERVASWGPETGGGLAAEIATEIAGTYPVLWGSDGATAAAAERFRNDLAENAKVPAHSAVLPELDHNEIVGLGAEGSDGRHPFPSALVCLRDPDEDARISSRFEATLAEVRGAFASVRHVEARGANPVARFCDLALLGSYASVYLAIARGVDPTPIPAISRLKDRLAEHQEG